METKPVNIHGDIMPVVRPVTSESIIIDNVGNAYAHLESPALNEGMYRLVCMACSDAGVMIQISAAGTSATISTGMYLPLGSPEYIFIKQGDIISVISGSLNITRVV